jgi:hypothetical protein
MDGRHPDAKDASGDIHVAWIPALHAGMTESRSRTETEPGFPPFVFSKEARSSHGSENFSIKNSLLSVLPGLQTPSPHFYTIQNNRDEQLHPKTRLDVQSL